ncbi:MAG: transposase [Elusimicrobia bacterium]|nr:transposase [Elusimicrobiota bacterium]
MGRPARIQFPGACYHVILQGNNRQDIFVNNQDRRYFLGLLKAHKERFELNVYAYCMLPNAVHIVLQTRRPNLSRVMQGFSTVYTKYFNAAHHMTGHVFQGRYKALIVDKDEYLTEVTRQVHLEPARAGMKERPWRYPWSSAAAYVEWGEGERDGLVDSDEVLKRIAKNRLKQSVRYLQQLKDGMKDPDAQRPPTVKGLFIGSPSFAASVGGAAAGAVEEDREGEARRILGEIVAKHGIDEERLLGRSQWREITRVRKEAIYRIWKEAKAGVSEIGRLFNRTPSAVCQLIRSAELESSKN